MNIFKFLFVNSSMPTLVGTYVIDPIQNMLKTFLIRPQEWLAQARRGLFTLLNHCFVDPSDLWWNDGKHLRPFRLTALVAPGDDALLIRLVFRILYGRATGVSLE